MPKIIEDEQVYLVALQTITERGYAGATTKQIAEAANMSEVTLFRKYGSKAELIRQAITAMAEQLDFESLKKEFNLNLEMVCLDCSKLAGTSI